MYPPIRFGSPHSNMAQTFNAYSTKLLAREPRGKGLLQAFITLSNKKLSSDISPVYFMNFFKGHTN
jgi:hypothetical protein